LNGAPCERCQSDKKLARIRGCDGKPAPSAVDEEEEEGVRIYYYNCPMNFIPNNILKWFREYRMYTILPGLSLGLTENISMKFLRAVEIYERYLNRFKSELAARGR
jgi:hypothetical protein